jgi:RHS repeat-associated protein
VTDPFGLTTTTLYNNDDQVTGTIDPRGQLTQYFFDSGGRQTAVTDPDNLTTTTLYDGDGNVSGTIDPRGLLTKYAFDNADQQTAVTDPFGLTTTTLYDKDGNVTGTIDPRNKLTQFLFDNADRQTAVTDPNNLTTTTLYDQDGNVTGTFDPRGKLTKDLFDAADRQTATIDADGNTTTTLYDGDGNVTGVFDPRFQLTQTFFDNAGRETAVTDPNNNTTTTLYDTDGNVTGTIDPRGKLTQYGYDTDNRQTSVTDPNNLTTTTLYDTDGNVSGTIDPRGLLTKYGFDNANRQTSVTDPANDTTTTLYDTEGNVTGTIDPRGKLTKYGFDTDNRQTSVTDPDNNVTTTLYDGDNNVTGTIDANNRLTTILYDSGNRETVTTDPDGNTTTTLYDQDGNVTGTYDPRGELTQFFYDSANQQTAVTDANSKTTTTLYDQDGNVTGAIDPRGKLSSTGYDAADRPITSTDANGAVTTTLYDQDGNVTGVIDPDNNLTQFGYDSAGRKTSMTDPLNHTATYAYNADDQVTSTTDRDGRRIANSYDTAGRVTGVTWIASDGVTVNDTLTFTYDTDGNQLTAADKNGTYTFSYDNASRVTAQQEPFGLTLTFQYDGDGNRTQVQDSFGGVMTSVYDNASQLTSRKFSDGTTQVRLDQTFNADGQVATQTRYNNISGGSGNKIGSSTFSYDNDGRISNLQHLNASGSNISNYTYTYDNAGNVLTETLNGSTTTYGYDNADQLINDTRNAYSYDPNGNRAMTGYQTGTGNQLLSDGTWTYSYDSEGNLIKKTKGVNAETWTYGYDQANHMISAVDRATDGGTILSQATYSYDAVGNLQEEDTWTSTAGLTQTRYGYDGNNIWADLNTSNQLTTRRIFGDGVNQPIASTASGSASWYLADRIGSIRDYLDSTGAVKDHVDYDGFGNIFNETHPTSGDRNKFQGGPFDAITQTYQYGVRIYGPTVARWNQEDPSGLTPDVNLYRGFHNDAINLTDPSGEATIVLGDARDSVRRYLAELKIETSYTALPSGRYLLRITPPEGLSLQGLLDLKPEELARRFGDRPTKGNGVYFQNILRGIVSSGIIYGASKTGTWVDDNKADRKAIESSDRKWLDGSIAAVKDGIATGALGKFARSMLRDMLKDKYPELYRGTLKALKEGKVEVAGELFRGALIRAYIGSKLGTPPVYYEGQRLEGALLERWLYKARDEARSAAKPSSPSGDAIYGYDWKHAQATAQAGEHWADISGGSPAGYTGMIRGFDQFVSSPGALQTSFGFGEVVAGVWTGNWLLVILGVDQIQAGVRTNVTGKPTSSALNWVVFNAAKDAGADDTWAHALADATEASVHTAAGFGLGKFRQTAPATPRTVYTLGDVPVDVNLAAGGPGKSDSDPITSLRWNLCRRTEPVDDDPTGVPLLRFSQPTGQRFSEASDGDRSAARWSEGRSQRPQARTGNWSHPTEQRGTGYDRV